MAHYSLKDPSRNYKMILEIDFHVVDENFLLADSSCLGPINR